MFRRNINDKGAKDALEILISCMFSRCLDLFIRKKSKILQINHVYLEIYSTILFLLF